MSSFPELQFDAAQNQRVQVREHVRGVILSGALPPGQRLPTTAALIAQARRLSRDEPCEPVLVGFQQVDKPKNF